MSTYFDVLEHITYEIRPGSLFMAKQMLHVAERSYLDTLLPFFARTKRILRPARGVYYRPYRRDRTPPGVAEIVRFRAEVLGETLSIDGSEAARSFGLIVADSGSGPTVAGADPRREVQGAQGSGEIRFHTDRRTRRLVIGGTLVRLRHVPAVVQRFPGTRAGDALAALHALGPGAAEAVVHVHDRLPDEDRRRMDDVLPQLPDRVATAWRVAARFRSPRTPRRTTTTPATHAWPA